MYTNKYLVVYILHIHKLFKKANEIVLGKDSEECRTWVKIEIASIITQIGILVP